MQEGVTPVLSRTDWELSKEAPAAVVEAAMRIAGSDNLPNLVAVLKSMADSGDSWVSRVAAELSSNVQELSALVKDMKHGLRPREELVREVLGKVKGVTKPKI
ncbi:hypothetical protein [Acidilobus sp.]|uniref:hypothetical protein n=1 Tax=Acidilobus sp. TaxID=1872109 RepID=UPI003CFC11EA